jgi:6-phosphogluconolactonase (cycloisomerase 2 family)
MAGRIVEGALGIVAAAILTGCGGGGGGSVYSASVAAQAAAPVQACAVTNINGMCAASTTPRFAYSLNYYGATLAIYNVDAATGQLRPRGYVKTGTSPVSAVSDVAQRFMFVLNQGAAQTPPNLPPILSAPSAVSVYTRDNVTGDLKEVSGSPYPISSTPAAATHITLHPSGKFLYVVNTLGVDNIHGWSINQITGQLAPMTGSP